MVRARIGSSPVEAVGARPLAPLGQDEPPRSCDPDALGTLLASEVSLRAGVEDRPSWLARWLSPLRARRQAEGPALNAPPVEPALGFLVELLGPLLGRTTRSVALGCLVALGGCGSPERVEVEGVVRDGRTGAPIAGARVSTDDGGSAETDDEGHFAVAVAEGSDRRITANAAGRCEATERVDVRRGATPSVTINLFERLEAPDELSQVGFDEAVRIEARPRCGSGAPLRWRQLAGPELGDERMRTERDGRVLVIRTHPLEELAQLDDRVGVIALDREQRGDYRFEVTDGEGSEAVTATVRVVAAPVASGLFQVPTGADVYLGGGDAPSHDWELLDRPDGSEATLSSPHGRVTRFRPDRFGTYLIEHRPSHTRMSIQAGAYEDVPRDCGREGCHEPEARGWTTTAHAATFRRGLEGALGEEFEPRCWSCHATGVDHGIDNGGLHHTAARIGWQQPAPDGGLWRQTPRRVRRHGSVWCSACHGPGRIVPPPFRWQYGAKLQVGVCARCHDVDADDRDANHVSLHVDEWELAAMSEFVRDLREDDPALRRGCASCHSAQGFVSWQRRGEHIAPERDTVAPITCGACHDAHDATNPAAVRVYDTARSLGSGGSPDAGQADHLGHGALCASCHRSGGIDGALEASAPHAPQGDVLIGAGSRLAPSSDGGAHRWIADTCARCHMSRPAEGDPLRGRAGGHTFSIRPRVGDSAVPRAACAPCHGDVDVDDIGVRVPVADGTASALRREFDGAWAQLVVRLRDRVIAASVRDGCQPSHVAAGVVDHDAQLLLADDDGRLLGDCDGDGVLSEGEVSVGVDALPGSLGDAAYDLSMIERDGSRGVHNPAYVFTVLDAVSRALR